MRENRPSGSEGGVALIPPSLPLSNAARIRRRHARSRQRLECGGLPPLCVSWAGVEPGPPQASRGRRLCLKLPVPPDGGMTSTPAGIGGTRSTASFGPGGTGPSNFGSRWVDAEPGSVGSHRGELPMGSLMGHGGMGFSTRLWSWESGTWGGPKGFAPGRRELHWDRVRLVDVAATVSGFVGVQLGGLCVCG